MTTLDTRNEFLARHLGPREADIAAMLERLGFDSLDALTDCVIPVGIQGSNVLDLPAGLGEAEALDALRAIASRNRRFISCIGQGYYATHTPAPIQRNMLENPGWYTAYTPYQAEISQGRLEALLNFQTMIIDLTGLDVANASLLDEATAAAEAMTMCQRLAKNRPARRSSSPPHCHPQTIDVVRTRAEPLGIEVVVGDERELDDSAAIFGALLQYPASTGRDLRLPRADRAACMARQAPGRRRRRPAGPDPADARPANSAPTSPSAAPSASACRWATAARTPPTSPPATHSSATCPAAWSASRRIATASRPCAWRCRPASSTSAARRPPATSAPPRCCWPSWPACTPSTTAPKA